jgi:hypothetical protein
MMVRDLIEMLHEMEQDAEVYIWDPDAEDYMPVTGAVHNETRVDLQSDVDP